MYLAKTPSLVKYFYKSLVWNIPTDEKVLYLTFDDGPIPEVTELVLEQLKKHNAKATFFCIGNNIEKHPEIFSKIIAGEHVVGNHTYNHLNGNFTGNESYFQNIDKCNQSIKNHLPENKTHLYNKLFRPPYGRMKKSQITYLKNNYSIIMLDVLSADFDQKITPEKCLKNVIKNARNGSVIIFHDSIKASKNMLYTLPTTLEYFSEKGYSFKPIDRLAIPDKD
jgi:peptidoglycan-N-acetylglucosamine deacetylase